MGASLLGGVGCGGGGEGGGEDSLVFAFNSTGAEGLRELIRRFNEDHRGEIRVEWREMPATSSQYFEQMQAELQSGESNVDVIGGDVTWAAQFAANGYYILDLSERFTDRMKENHLDGTLQTVEYDGKTWGVPWFTDAGMLFYRRDLLERAGFSEPPTTWDEMKEMARKVKADLGARDGYVFQGSQDEGGRRGRARARMERRRRRPRRGQGHYRQPAGGGGAGTQAVHAHRRRLPRGRPATTPRRRHRPPSPTATSCSCATGPSLTRCCPTSNSPG